MSGNLFSHGIEKTNSTFRSIQFGWGNGTEQGCLLSDQPKVQILENSQKSGDPLCLEGILEKFCQVFSDFLISPESEIHRHSHLNHWTRTDFESSRGYNVTVTLMLVTDVGDELC